MLSCNMRGSCVLVRALTVMLVTVLSFRQRRTGWLLAAWLMSRLVDTAVGAGGYEGDDLQAADKGSGPRGRGMPCFTPWSKRLLNDLVRKIEIPTGPISLNLRADQQVGQGKLRERIATRETMTEEQAETANREVLAVLDDTQIGKQATIGLPYTRGGRGASCGQQSAEDANPFAEPQTPRSFKLCSSGSFNPVRLQ